MNTELTTSPGAKPLDSAELPLELLIELGQATTFYHDAPPERLASARKKYEDLLKDLEPWLRR